MARVHGNKTRVRAGRLSGLLLLVTIATAGCAELQSIFVPPPAPPPPAPPAPPPPGSPPKAPPVKKELPPPVLSPQMGREDEERLRQEANGKVQRAEQTVQQVDQRKLAKDQEDTYATIRSFIASAREALTVQDFLKASNLAEKAQLLAEDLLAALR